MTIKNELNVKEDIAAFKHIKVEKKGHVLTIVLNRSEKNNILDQHTVSEVCKLITEVRSDVEVKVIVITGSGSRFFSNGYDVSQFLDKNSMQAQRFAIDGQRMLNDLENLEKPVIAAVNGDAMGAGLELCLACDMIFAVEHAKFGLPEIDLGLIPGWGGTQRLPRRIGITLAKELIFTGRKLTATEALDINLINKVLTKEKLYPETYHLAKILIDKSPKTIKNAKSALNAFYESDLYTGMDIETQLFSQCFSRSTKELIRKSLTKKRSDE